MNRLCKLINAFRQTIMRCDLLASAPTMRIRGEPAYQSVLGGVLSVAIMSFFIAVFFNNFIEVFQRVDISSNMRSTDNTDSQTDVTDIRFAVSIQGVQLGAGPRYFDIYLEQIKITGNAGQRPDWNRTQIMLEPCKLGDWKDIGNNFQAQFNVLKMDKMLCIKDSATVSLQGYEGSSNYDYLVLKVNKCTNNSYDSHICKPQPEINSFISNQVSNKDFFKVRFFIVDTRITQGDLEPVTKILQKKIFLSFTDTLGTKGFISFAHYNITTDTSLLPYSEETSLTGSYIHKYSTSTTGVSSDRYIYLQFFKATEELIVSRKVSKVDQMLSYVGGLFGLLWVIVAFFFASFNEYRYELYASEAAFTFDETGRKIKQKDFGFMTYVGYSIYDWLNTFGLAPKCWNKMRQIDQTRQEICEQLDVTYLFRKIRSLQKITACLLNQNKRICSMLTRQPTLQETQKQRKLLELYSKLNPSPCQSHFDKSVKNKVENTAAQQTGQDFVLNDKMANEEQFQNQIEQMSCISDTNLDDDEEYEQIMNIIRDAYASIEGQNDEICKRIKQKIPSAVKKAMQKKQYTRKLIVQDLEKRKFDSCQHSFIQAKLK